MVDDPEVGEADGFSQAGVGGDVRARVVPVEHRKDYTEPQLTVRHRWINPELDYVNLVASVKVRLSDTISNDRPYRFFTTQETCANPIVRRGAPSAERRGHVTRIAPSTTCRLAWGFAAIAGLLVATVTGNIALAAGPNVPLTGDHVEKVPACDPGDRPEPGLQGEVPPDVRNGRSAWGGSFCNMELIGYNDIDKQGMSRYGRSFTRQWAMSWYRDCAYVETTSPDGAPQIAVIDAANARKPQLIELLDLPFETHEHLKVSEARGYLIVPKESVFAAATVLRTGNPPDDYSPAEPELLIYDIKDDCRNPKLITHWVGNASEGLLIHAGAITPDGNTFYATGNWHAPCFHAWDLIDLKNPRFMGSYGKVACHDLGVGRDGKKLYVGSYGNPTFFGELVGGSVPAPISPLLAPGINEFNRGLEIFDVSEIQQRKPNPQITQLGALQTGAPHTVAVAGTAGRRLVFQTNEGACRNGAAGVVDATNLAQPKWVASLALEIQTSPSCISDFYAGQAPSVLAYATHYYGFDSTSDSTNDHEPQDVTTAFLTAYWSGLRVFDVRDPDHPREVAYFNPGYPDWFPTNPWPMGATTWVRYRPNGEIWFGHSSGFYIVRMTRPLPPQAARPNTSGTTGQVPSQPPTNEVPAAGRFSCLIPAGINRR